MAGKGVRSLAEAMRGLSLSSQTTCRTASPAASFLSSSNFTRSMATEAPLPGITTSIHSKPNQIWTPTTSVPVTIHAFPTLEPQSLESYSTKHLYLPLRRDLLHLAVVYEGDSTRQGTASTKTRWEVRGSHRKIHPQKGTGRARAGTRQSPIRRGGGVTHGPKPRDFSTRLNRKVYDVAWRTALSYRYRRGELVVCEDGMELPLPLDFTTLAEQGFMGPQMEHEYRRKWMLQVLEANQWGKAHGRTLFVTAGEKPRLYKTMEAAGDQGRCLNVNDVDVKDLLETGRVVVERAALKEMLEAHQSDLVSKIFINGITRTGPTLGESLV
ncbi:mitochondrial 54S ribosomal protein uL4m [Colletotrichum truncatum]|uniref:54S ribosomal protein yml6, mitochondrial n=1 Tax=Colletotrichum truncatum TaxID=5467 RepID=A0ACC3ZHV5_COLTU|nr:54S ribosomal protein yml6, mitochondrial [Colletotrichum truncatum]KAF6786749.1 54S ribosomal protein yml6, mitochondrial [Colletotrichum truncatum]